MTKDRIRTLMPVTAILAVNVTAFFGQLGFLRDHLGWILPGDILFAFALESVAIYLAYMAHQTLISNDSALRLRLASYAAGLVVAGMNYSHYSDNGKPTFTAVAVGLMSASSPWLWSIHSRRESRDTLMAKGLIEPHALRLGSARWLWHPAKSVRVMSFATWSGETDPREAIAVIEPSANALPEIKTLADMTTKADAVRFALRQMAADSNGTAPAAADAAAWLQDHAAGLAEPAWQIPASYVRDIMRRDSEALARQRRSTVHAIESGDSPRTAAGI
jgi:hypothetical protein